MKLFALVFFLFACESFTFGQTTFCHAVHFASGNASINKSEQEKMDAFFSKIEDDNLEKIEISGHTDSDGSDAYNLELSKRRVESVQAELAKLELNITGSSELFLGETSPIESNGNSQGKRQNRRVEICITLAPPPKTITIPVPVLEPDCSYDTTIIFPQGTEVTMNVCDYHSIKDCFQFIEYNTGESIRNSDLTTQTADGTPLISGGMFEVKMCKDVEISVAIPQIANPCDTTAEFKLWTATSEGTWSPVKGTIDRFRRGGRNFLRTVVQGTTKINLDALPSAPPPKTIVKVPMGYTILKAKLSTDTPASLIYGYEVKKRKAKFKSLCPCSEPLLYLEVENPDGDTIKIDYAELNDFDSHEAFGQCRSDEVVKRIVFFKVRQKRIYRKYLIRKKDLQVTD
jgi:hypothetical protein